MTRKNRDAAEHPATRMLQAAIRRRVAELGKSHWQLMEEAGLSRNAARYILESKDVRWTNVANVLSVLELELYVGEYRDLGSPLLLPETLESAAGFERLARGALPEGEALAELVKVHLKLLRSARRKRPKKRHRTS